MNLLGRAILYLLIGALLILIFVGFPTKTSSDEPPLQSQIAPLLGKYLAEKESPLAPDAEFLVGLPHWKLVVALSAAESSLCKHEVGNNCWGIVSGDSSYQSYRSFREGAQAANDLIERRQSQGMWLSVEDMNCSYVVPCNPVWVRNVNYVLGILGNIERDARGAASANTARTQKD